MLRPLEEEEEAAAAALLLVWLATLETLPRRLVDVGTFGMSSPCSRHLLVFPWCASIPTCRAGRTTHGSVGVLHEPHVSGC